MKLNKTSQKIDNNICKALTTACESSLHEVPGFLWLTHRANYTNFPASLIVTCVFNNQTEIEEIKIQQQDIILRNTIQKQLLSVGVVVKNIKQQVHFDSEEACLQQHDGEWSQRLAIKVIKQKPNSDKSGRGRR
tara:strand:- start:107 stop:508 length:402 start_codon:yes stop_codon:yes gene_type:complete